MLPRRGNGFSRPPGWSPSDPRLLRPGSASLEYRGTLLAEGADTFRRVLRLEADVLRHGLHLERAAQVEVLVGVERSLSEADGHGRSRGDPARHLVGSGQELLPRHHPAHDAEPERFL